jgi:DNA-binding MarR family transcriptional regulator
MFLSFAAFSSDMMNDNIYSNSQQIEFLESYQLAAIGHMASGQMASLFDDGFGLQVPDWRILVLLVEVDYLSFKEVVEHTGMEKSRVSRAHARLQKAGLIQVSKGPFDNRTLVMKLTPKGQKVCEAALPKVRERNEALLEALSMEERALLTSILSKLSVRVKEMTK